MSIAKRKKYHILERDFLIHFPNDVISKISFCNFGVNSPSYA